MGNPSIEVNEENKEIAQMLKSSAMDAVLEGMFLNFYIFIYVFSFYFMKKFM